MDDMGAKPGPDYSLDRIDNNAGYLPGNCRQASSSKQNLNLSNRGKYAKGVTKSQNRFQVNLTAGRVKVFLGRFNTEQEAHKVWRNAYKEWHGCDPTL